MNPFSSTSSRLLATLVATLSVVGVAFNACAADAPSAVELAKQTSRIADPTSFPGKGILTSEDEAFLDDLQRRGIQFFIDYADPVSGLMPDRAKADGSKAGDVASIASVGFGLTALCIGHERGWVSRDEAYNRSLRVLTFLRDKCEHKHGHFYHFLDMRSGKRVWDCEISNIDTALLMAGVITVQQHFPNTELSKLCGQLFDRVEWGFLTRKAGALSMGWKPESGFIEASWSHYNEGFLIYLLGMGSKTHPLPASSWNAWQRVPVMKYAGLTFAQCPPLFTHQYPQCWFDLRGMRDDHMDYFRNSRLATLAQRQWTIDELTKQFPTYGQDMWGISASDTAHGYDAWGGPPLQGKVDGSVVPCAAAGSLAFEPRLCLDTLKAMKKRYGDKAYLKYGFVDAFNPANGWYNEDVLGIDVGPTVVMAENCRSGFVWKTFMSSEPAKTAMKVAKFRALAAEDVVEPTISVFGATEAGKLGSSR